MRTPSYATYQEAAAACRPYGYEADDLVQVVFQKTKTIRDRLRNGLSIQIDPGVLETLFATSVAMGRREELRVLDFGGGCGVHYFFVKAFYGDRININWHVVETPSMRRKALELRNDELKFFESIEEARVSLGRIDLTHSAGALQCVPDPWKYLRELLGCGAQYLLLNRWDITLGISDIVIVYKSKLSKNGPGSLPSGLNDGITRFPYTFLAKAKVDSVIGKFYNLKYTSEDNSAIHPILLQPTISLSYFAELIKD